MLGLSEFIKQYRITHNVKRFSMESVIAPQNIASHGYGVGSLFFLLCRAKGVECTAEELFGAMNHDFVETYTGDLNKKIKDMNTDTKEAWDTIEGSIVPIHAFSLTDKNLKNRVFREEVYPLLLMADYLEALLYCREEEGKGNSFLKKAREHYVVAVKALCLEQIKESSVTVGTNVSWINSLNAIYEEVSDGI